MEKFRFNSIFVKNFFVIALLEILMTCVLSNLYATKMEESVMDEIKGNVSAELERSADTLDGVIDQMFNFAYFISGENDVKMLNLSGGNNRETERVMALRDKIETYIKTFEYVDSVYVYLEKINYVISENGEQRLSTMVDKGWLGLYNEVENESYKLTARTYEANYPFLLTMVRPIYDAQNKKEGAVVVNVNMEELNDAIGRSFLDQQRLYMTDLNNQIYYSNVVKTIKYEELIPEKLKSTWLEITEENHYFEITEEEGEEVAISAIKSRDGKRYYWLYTPMSFYGERIRLSQKYVVQNALWAIVVGCIVSLVLAMQSYRPVRRIMRTVEGEDLGEEFIDVENREDEVQYILGMIASTKRKNVKLQLEADEWVRRLGQAQIQALQGQIDPHFLYNTLDTINWMVLEEMGEGNKASKAIYTLAQLLRSGMKRSSYLITFEEELEHARLYMELLHIRYPDRLTVEWEIEPACRESKVIRLCLQPILENAVRHGLRTKRYKGTVYVKGNIECNSLIVRIEDDGVGMSEEACLEMNTVLNSEYQLQDNHLGIKNVNQRIKILFGEDYGIQLQPRDGGGLTVIICFPVS